MLLFPSPLSDILPTLEGNITQENSFLDVIKDNCWVDLHGKDQVSNVFQEFNSKWEYIKYTFNAKAICTESVTAAHTTQTRTMFWTLKRSTSYQCFSLLKKGNEKEIITHFLEAQKMLTKYCLCHI